MQRLWIAREAVGSRQVYGYDQVYFHAASEVVNKCVVHVLPEVTQHQLAVTLVGLEVSELPLTFSFFHNILHGEN